MMTPAQVECAASLFPAAYKMDEKWGRGQKVLLFQSLGQAIHESWTRKGKPSRLALEAHNWWGIKAFKSWPGETVRLDTFEFVDGKKVWLRGEKAPKWRKYPDDFAAFMDYGKLINGPIYVSAFRHLPADPSLPPSEEQEHAFIREIAAHWATDPNYARRIEDATDLIQEEFEAEKIVAFTRAITFAVKAVMQTIGGGHG